MANESFSPPENAGARSPRGDRTPTLIEDPSTAARQRFLDEVIGRPPSGPSEKLQVIRDSEDKKPPEPKQTPLDTALTFHRRAHTLLEQAHDSLSYTNDQFEPRVIAFHPSFRTDADTTANAIAKVRLGTSASEQQIKFYAECLIKLNKLEGTTPDTAIKKDTALKLPGQRSDGALSYRSNGATVNEWYDGSTERITERGRGSISVTDKDGTKVQISWNPERASETADIRIKDNKRTEVGADGTTIEKTKNEKDGKWNVTQLQTTDSKGRTLVATFEAGKKNAETLTITDKDKNVIKLKWDGKESYTGEKLNAKGEVVEKDVHASMSRNGISIYWENANGTKGKTRTYENGSQEDYTTAGELSERRGKDAWNRNVTEKYEEDEALPYQIDVKVSDKETISFERKPFGFYSALYKDADGKEIGTIDLRRNGLLVYNNEKEQTAQAELPDGTKILRKHLPDAKQEITETKDGNVLRRTVDRQGSVVDAEYTSTDGRKIYRKLSADGSSIEKVVITDADKAQTELSYDRDIGVFTGTRRNKDNQLLEKCFYFQGKIVFTDVKTGDARFEKLNFLEKDLFGLKISPGTYDPLTGTITTTAPDGSKTVESFSPGRTDQVKDGTISGSTVTGERSAVLPTGEAVVHNPDDSGSRLNRDGSVDRWGHEDAQNAQEEPLTKVEGEYLRKHRDIDRRDLLAIHAAYHDEPTKLDAFYKSLSTLDDKALTLEEKRAMRKDIMHHVAFPAEIYQGNSWCCNVAVCERDMAMNMPDKYAEMLIKAVAVGKVDLPDGTVLPVDKCNLKVVDSTGRDFASRVFQTIAIQAKYHPTYNFMNTEDGVGRLIPVDPKMKPAAFVGLNMDDIAAVRYKLSGEKKAVVAITSIDDLFIAWNENKSRSMTVAVNADEAPFSDNGMGGLFAGQTESSPNHVVSITRLEEGPPPIAYVQNQWGLRNDLSTPDTAVPVEVLLHSMMGRIRDTRGRIVATPAQALTSGEPTKTYLIKDGKLLEEKRRK